MEFLHNLWVYTHNILPTKDSSLLKNICPINLLVIYIIEVQKPKEATQYRNLYENTEGLKLGNGPFLLGNSKGNGPFLKFKPKDKMLNIQNYFF